MHTPTARPAAGAYALSAELPAAPVGAGSAGMPTAAHGAAVHPTASGATVVPLRAWLPHRADGAAGSGRSAAEAPSPPATPAAPGAPALERPTLPPPLARLLAAGQLVSRDARLLELAGPGGVAWPAGAGWAFHLVLQGEAVIDDGQGQSLRLVAGDLVLLPQGEAHRLLHRLGEAPQAVPEADAPQADAWQRIGAGGLRRLSEPPTRLVSGRLCSDDALLQRLAAELPPMLLLRAASEADGAPAALWPVLQAEADAMALGQAAVVVRLAEALLLRTLRGWLSRWPAADRGWLAAWQDPALAAALGALHRDPGRPWTLRLLAACAGLSRSGFAARFSRQLGEAPMQYLARWRMAVARARLAAGGVSVAAVAGQLGYASEAAFCRAYRRLCGNSPRRSARAAGPG